MSSRDFAQRFVAGSMGFNFKPNSRDSFGQQFLDQEILRPQERYNRSRQQGLESAASRAGRANGYADGYDRFGGAEATARYEYTRGQETVLRRHYNDMGRQDTYDALGYGQSGGQRASRYNDNGRYAQNYRGEAAQGYDDAPATRSAGPVNQYEYQLQADGKRYTIVNDQPLSQEQQQEIAGALRFIDKQHVRGEKRDQEVGALQHAFANGLSPDALVADGRGRAEPLRSAAGACARS